MQVQLVCFYLLEITKMYFMHFHILGEFKMFLIATMSVRWATMSVAIKLLGGLANYGWFETETRRYQREKFRWLLHLLLGSQTGDLGHWNAYFDHLITVTTCVQNVIVKTWVKTYILKYIYIITLYIFLLCGKDII